MKNTTFQRLHQSGDIVHGMKSVGLSFPDAVLSGDPQESAHIFYDRRVDQATVGIWESEAGTLRFDPYPFDELCVVVEGEVALEDETGHRDAFRAGDAFIIEKTFSGLWIMPRRLRKFFVELKSSSTA